MRDCLTDELGRCGHWIDMLGMRRRRVNERGWDVALAKPKRINAGQKGVFAQQPKLASFQRGNLRFPMVTGNTF